MPTYELQYFPIPGRAEATRLAFTVGGIPFTDTRHAGPHWRAMKEQGKVPPGAQLPLLTIDGEHLTQSLAILRYVGKIAHYEGSPLYPQDPLTAARVDELLDCMEDLHKPLMTTFSIQDQSEKEERRLQLITGDGAMRKSLTLLDERLGKSASGYAVGETLTIADLRLFCELSMLRSGWLDGVPRDCLAGFSHIAAHKDRIAALPPVLEYYSHAEGYREVYQPGK
eukprot:TRINITY_DN299_c0_g1_i1.p1 TRINITY_DN299_c0_g1~~TRINITY_DN299_c0_g1_i1.p1  ORF type:complete len:252 (+),score=58.33 TRINITY_DN299_c0_g1_i1:83-757(+)